MDTGQGARGEFWKAVGEGFGAVLAFMAGVGSMTAMVFRRMRPTKAVSNGNGKADVLTHLLKFRETFDQHVDTEEKWHTDFRRDMENMNAKIDRLTHAVCGKAKPQE